MVDCITAPRYMRIEEVSRRLGQTVRMTRNDVAAGRLHVVTKRGTTRPQYVSEAELQRFMREEFVGRGGE